MNTTNKQELPTRSARVVEKTTCWAVVEGNVYLGNFAGPEAEELATRFAAMVNAPEAAPAGRVEAVAWRKPETYQGSGAIIGYTTTYQERVAKLWESEGQTVEPLYAAPSAKTAQPSEATSAPMAVDAMYPRAARLLANPKELEAFVIGAEENANDWLRLNREFAEYRASHAAPAVAAITDENCGEVLTQMLMDCAERFGNFPRADIDPRAWQHILVYAPAVAAIPRERTTPQQAAALAIKHTDLENDLQNDLDMCEAMTPKELAALIDDVLDHGIGITQPKPGAGGKDAG